MAPRPQQKRKAAKSVPTRRAKTKPRKASAALDARQEFVRSKRAGKAQASTKNPNSAMQPAFTVIDVMSRSSRPYIELPLRLFRARSPIEFWNAQIRFMQEVIAEGFTAVRLLTNGR